MKNNPLIHTLIHLEGNPRACVYTEPLWGIPANLYGPYASVFMLALGVTDAQIGLIASLFIVSQILFAFLGGIITDKLGRKRTTLIFDLISWSIPTLIWACSQNVYYFAIAAMINGVMRVTANSWVCLLVEDCDKSKIVTIYTWVYISGLGAAFFAPITGIFVGIFDLIPTIRGVYVLAFIMMTAKFIILNKYATETRQGVIRMKETKDVSILKMLHGYHGVIKHILNTPETLLTLALMVIMSIVSLINNTFWAVIATEKLSVAPQSLGFFSFAKSIIMLLFFFLIIPKINALKFKRPMILGFGIFIMSQVILIFTPTQGYLILVISIILEACSLSLINPLLESLQVVMVDPQERARIIAILFVIVLSITSPFGWIAGLLSSMDKRLPFVLNLILLLMGVLVTIFVSHKKAHVEQVV
ncbi:MAG: MFS transporter [Vallitaleaceae bacterium]|nr:MFS transporter [Vallitaleaceae bacterium]